MAAGLSGSLWTWEQTGLSAVPQRGQRWSRQCSRGESGEAHGNGPLFGLRGYKRETRDDVFYEAFLAATAEDDKSKIKGKKG